MTLDQAVKELKEIEDLSKKIKCGDPDTGWSLLLARYEKINDIAKENEWTSLQDAGIVVKSLVQKILADETADFSQASQLIDSINIAIGKLLDDIKKNGNITISIKGIVAEAKLFLGDFDYISTEESGENTQAEFDDIDIFDEFKKRVTNIENLVLDLDETSYDEESIKVIFREYHTLKGEAGFTGLTDLSAFCHKVESAIEPLRHKSVILSKEITDLFLYFADVCKSYIENAQHSSPLPDEQEVDQNIEVLKNHIEQSEETSSPTDAPSEAPEEESKTSEFASAFPLDDEEESMSEEKEGKQVVDSVEQPETGEPSKKSTQKESIPGDAGKLSPPVKDRRATDGLKKLDMGSNMAKVDALVEIAGELTILYQTINQSPEIKAIGSDRLTNDLDAMGRLFKDLQALMMSIRMTPITPLFQRLNRIIRDSSRQEKKNVEVKMEGTSTVIDKNLVEDISGGLVHIVRNSVGHGVETPRERLQSGKEEKGTITLKAFRDANNVVIEISDNGRGISKKKILERAIEQGIVSPKDSLDEQEIFDLLFLPGFTTAQKVTGLSGRGVGMDVVKTSIEKLRGRIEMSSEEGKGTKTRLILPFTFAIIEGLVVRIGKDFFVIPLAQVHEMMKLETQNIMHMKGDVEFIDMRGNLLPLVKLHNLFSEKNNEEGDSGDSKVALSIEHDHRMCSLLVDEVVAAQEIVLKELKGSFSHLKYISAAGILGNRRIGLVLDVREITNDIYTRINPQEIGRKKIGKRDEGQVEIVEIGTNQVAMIDFFVEWKSGEKKQQIHLAINTFKTKEFIAKTRTVMLPKAPKGFSGMLTLRGKTIPVFSLGKLLMPYLQNGDITEKLIIICEFSKKEVGFLVSKVNKVNYISWDEILPPPNSNNLINIHNIVGTILKDKEITFILDFEKLIDSVMNLYDSLEIKGGAIKTRKPHNTILLVEDSALMRKRIKEALEKSGLKIIEAVNGKEGLDIIDKFYHMAQKSHGSIFDYVDLVLTDIEMPLLDGYTFTKTIKSHPDLRVLPVLLHSSLSNETIVQRAKEVRADGFVSKCDPNILFQALEKYL